MNNETLGRELFDRIGNGRENAIKRPLHNAGADRLLRELINQANKTGEDLIIPRGDGYGYYRPMPCNKADMLEYTIYMAKETTRKNDIETKLEKMREVMGRRIEEYLSNEA